MTRRRQRGLAALAALALATAATAAPTALTPPPTMGRPGMAGPGGGEEASRKSVDRRIQAYTGQGRRATLGLLKEIVGDAVGFGAPAYNRGEIDASARFYQKTAEDLTAAFSDAKATPGAARELAALRTALARCAKVASPDRRAWLVRFAFDRITLDWGLAAFRVKGLTDLGNQNFGAERYTEAADAYGESVEVLEDISGDDANGLDAVLRTAGVMHAHALMADHDYGGAAHALIAGLAYMPELPHRPFDLTKIFRKVKLDALVAELEAAAAKPGAKADEVFLLGYMYLCTGKTEPARAQFKKALTLEPAHAGAQRFLKDL